MLDISRVVGVVMSVPCPVVLGVFESVLARGRVVHSSCLSQLVSREEAGLVGCRSEVVAAGVNSPGWVVRCGL